MNFHPDAMPVMIILHFRKRQEQTSENRPWLPDKLSRFNSNHYCFSAVLQDDETGSFVYMSNQHCAWDEITECLSAMKERRAG